MLRKPLPLIISALLFLLILPVISESVPDFNADRAWGYLMTQCEFGPRNPGSRGHARALSFILSTISPLADTVLRQDFPYQDPYANRMLTLTNIIARFNLSAPQRTWIATHWDTRPWADLDRDPQKRTQPILGANDGASGVAVLLELAHHLVRNPPAMGVDLVFLDGEDMGKTGDFDRYFNGSRYLARNIPQPIPKYCILIDMIGDKELTVPMEKNSLLQTPELMKSLWKKARHLELIEFVDAEGYEVMDDHVILFQKGGIPSIDIIDFDYPNPDKNYWHTTQDTPDKCSPKSLETVGKLLLHHIYTLP